MTIIDRFTAANNTNIHGRTPPGAPQPYNVTAGSFSIQGNEAQSGSTNSTVYIDTEETNLTLSTIVRTGDGSTYNALLFRWDQVANTGWRFYTHNGSLYYYNGTTETFYDHFNYGFHGNGDRWYYEVDLTNPASITVYTYNMQFSGYGWWPAGVGLTVSSTLNNDKTSVGFSTTHSGVKFDCLRCQTGSYELHPRQQLFEARIQKSILEDHVPNIISSYNTGTPDRVQVWAEGGSAGPYYDGPYGLKQIRNLWGSPDGDLFEEAGWKQQEILHDDYYIGTCDPDYSTPGYKHFSRGPRDLWLSRSNQDDYDTVRYFPTLASYASYVTGNKVSPANTDEDTLSGLHRECAYALSAHVEAYKIGGVAQSGLDTDRWDTLREYSYDWMDYWCDEISPGVYAWTGSERQVAAFMIGLMLRSLWDDYTISADSRFPATLLKGCNFVWTNFWKPSNSPYPGMLYDLNPDSPSYGSVGVQNDLNNLITAAFAKCAQLTGDQTHMDRADTLISNLALYGAFYSSKEKNQAITWYEDFVNWRADFTPILRRSGRLLRRSA